MKKIIILIFFCLTSVFSFSQEQTMYWIGGSGNWDDLTHWSFQSGSQGNTLPSSIPNADTHVIFNAASGLSGTDNQASRSINVRLSGAVARSLTFADDLTETNSPRFYGNQTLTVRGDITLKQYVSVQNKALISSPNENEVANVSFNQNPLTHFEKEGAGKTIVSEIFPLNMDLIILNGVLEYQPTTIQINDLRLLGKLSLPNVTVFSLHDLSDQYGTLVNSELILPLGATINANNWYFRGDLNAPQSTLYLTGSVFYTKANASFYKVFFNSNALTLTCTGIVHFEELSFNTKELTVVADSYISSKKYLLAPGIVINLRNRVKIEVTEEMNLYSSACNELAFINSSDVASANFINATGNDIVLDKIVFNIITFSNTDNSTAIADGAGNTGNYSFITPTRSDFYWVGNGATANWNDPLNWSNTQNGPSGTCLPTILDDVFISSSSSLDIVIDNKAAEVHNIIINAPQLSISGLNLLVSGSWEMSANSIINSKVLFSTDFPGNQITSNTSVFTNTTFDGRGGWIFQDNFKTITGGSIDFRGGTINTNEKNVFLDGDFYGEVRFAGGLPRTLIMQKSEFSVNNFYFAASHHPCYLYANELDSHIILRNGINFRINSVKVDKVTVYDQSLNNTNVLEVFYGDLSEINDFTIYAKTTNFLINSTAYYWINNLKVGNLKILPAQGSPIFNVGSHLTVVNFEVGPLANISFRAGKNFNILGDFISNTIDCTGLMRLDVSNKAPGEFFNFSSENDIFIQNVSLNGVKAANNGVSYEATGVIGDDTSGFEIISQTSKDLYWIGTTSNDWNDPLNWTTDSTGATSLNPCVPSANDNVYFESFSSNGVGGLNISVSNSIAFFKNFYAANAPVDMVFIGLDMNAYGDVMQFGSKSRFELTLNHFGSKTATSTTFTSPDSNLISITNLKLDTYNPSYIWNMENNLNIPNQFISYGGIVNLLNNSYIFKQFYQDRASIINVSQSLNVNNYYAFLSGEFNAENTTLNFGNLDSNSGKYRLFNIVNSTVTAIDLRLTSTNIVVNASSSHIKLLRNFYCNPDHKFNILETPTNSNSYLFANNGTFNELRMYGNTRIVNDLNIGKLFMSPKSLMLTIDPNVTLNITQEMEINGTPCQFNRIEGGITNNSNIAYANPNLNNTFDFVSVRNINATDADLIFNVNSSVQDSNNKVIKLAGTPGVIGLGDNRLCQVSYFLLASGFYGNELSTYKWFKKDDNGVFIQLNVTEESDNIDVRNFGYDGTYKVEIVYDSTVPIQNQCKSEDEITITFVPINVEFETNPLGFCIGSSPTLSDVRFDASTIQYMEDTGATLNWYSTSTGVSQIPLSTPLVENVTYYASLTNGVSCESAIREPLTIVFNEIPVSNAGPNQSGITGQTFTMQANNPIIGSGKWVVLSGDVYVTDPLSYNTTVTLLSGELAELQWEVDNNGCIITDSLIIGKLPFVPIVNPSNRIRVSGK